MKEPLLLRAIGDIGEDLVAEAQNDAAFAAACRRQRTGRLRRLGALAACLVLLLASIPMLRMLPLNDPAGSAPADPGIGDKLNGSQGIFDGLLDDTTASEYMGMITLSPTPAEGDATAGLSFSLSIEDGLLLDGYRYQWQIEADDGLQLSHTVVDVRTLARDAAGCRTLTLHMAAARPDAVYEGSLRLSLLISAEEGTPLLLSERYSYTVENGRLYIA